MRVIAYHLALRNLQRNAIMSSFFIPKVLKIATQLGNKKKINLKNDLHEQGGGGGGVGGG